MMVPPSYQKTSLINKNSPIFCVFFASAELEWSRSVICPRNSAKHNFDHDLVLNPMQLKKLLINVYIGV